MRGGPHRPQRPGPSVLALSPTTRTGGRLSCSLRSVHGITASRNSLEELQRPTSRFRSPTSLRAAPNICAQHSPAELG
ncbi:hypothetical protein JCM10207_000472 [Rhodosporidiobolus poonsookiae]